MNTIQSLTISKKLLFIIGGILLVIIIFYLIVSLSFRKKSQFVGTSSQSQNSEPTPFDKNAPTPTYIPPSNFTYNTVDSVNFIPKQVDRFIIDPAFEKTAHQVFPDSSGPEFIDVVNKTLFTWLALNEFYAKNNPSLVSAVYNESKINNFPLLQTDVENMKEEYTKNVISVDGVYMQIRYKGIVDTNLKQLKKTEVELQPIAQELIQNYRQKLIEASDKNSVIADFNKDNTILLMNNRQTVEKFNNYNLYPPLFEAQNFSQLIQSLPVGQVSPVINVDNYSYVVFYLSKKNGLYPSLDELNNTYIKKVKLH